MFFYTRGAPCRGEGSNWRQRQHGRNQDISLPAIPATADTDTTTACSSNVAKRVCRPHNKYDVLAQFRAGGLSNRPVHDLLVLFRAVSGVDGQGLKVKD